MFKWVLTLKVSDEKRLSQGEQTLVVSAVLKKTTLKRFEIADQTWYIASTELVHLLKN